jgi:hypothetical protein
MIGSRVKWVDPGQQKKSSKSQSKLDPWHFIHRRTQNSNQLVIVEWSSGPLRKKENKLMDHKIQIARSLSVCLSPSFLCLTTAPAFLFHRRLFLSSLGCSCWLFPCKWFPYHRRDSSLANGFPTIEEYFSTNREEADSSPASCIGRDGVLYLEETRALAGPGKNN